MKHYILFISISFALLFSCSSSNESTTYYLIRHAEKDRTDSTNRNPNLNPEGETRAQNWAFFFKDIPLDAVYTTNYNRTIQTATPTAKSKNIELKYYSPNHMFDSIFQVNTKGKKILIVGHSNTTPMFANKIINTYNKAISDNKNYNAMDDNDNSSLFIVKIDGESITTAVEKINR